MPPALEEPPTLPPAIIVEPPVPEVIEVPPPPPPPPPPPKPVANEELPAILAVLLARPIAPPGEKEAVELKARISRLAVLPHFADPAVMDSPGSRAVLAQLSRYLSSKLGFRVIDQAQIAKDWKDEIDSGADHPSPESFFGREAALLGADLRIEIAATIAADAKLGRSAASSRGQLSLWFPGRSTPAVSYDFASLPAYSPSSLDTAAASAIIGSLWPILPAVGAMATASAVNDYAKGFPQWLSLSPVPTAATAIIILGALPPGFVIEDLSVSDHDSLEFALRGFMTLNEVREAFLAALRSVGFDEAKLVAASGSVMSFEIEGREPASRP
ncbi:MAG: hypothetical protein WCQ50_14535 [Spirochaetota bacterium]